MASNLSKRNGNNNASFSSSNPGSSASQSKSDNRLLKDCGYRNMKHFMDSYGLKISDDDDLAEAKEILKGFRKIDEETGQGQSGAARS